MARRRPSAVWFGLLLLGALAWFAWRPQAPVPKAQPRPQEPTPGPAADGPRLAIVLDDWGYQKAPIARLKLLPGPLTLAVIPRLTHSRLAAQSGAELGHELIVHVPMQAKGAGHPEPGMLLPGMSALQVRAGLEQDFISVPGAVGINNHEGSLASEDRALMDAVAAVLKDRQAYFLDSVTSPKSAIPAAAEAAGVPWASRRVFLDNSADPADIAARLDEAVAFARRRGACIAIGHPRPGTLDVLQRRLPQLRAEGVKLVKASELLVRP